MIDIQQEVRKELAALRDKFLARLPDSLSKIEAAWSTVRTQARDGRNALSEEAHSLAGTAGIFGLLDISRTASAIETILMKAGTRNLTNEELNALQAAVDHLRAAAPCGSPTHDTGP